MHCNAKLGSWNENEVAGFVVISQEHLMGYFGLGYVNSNRLEIGENTLVDQQQ